MKRLFPLLLLAVSCMPKAIVIKEKRNVSVKEEENLHDAAAKGDLESVQRLIQGGKDVNGQARDRSTALHLAAANGQLAVVEFLLQEGAKVCIYDSSGKTPWHLAAANGQLAVVEFLLQNNAAVDAKDLYDCTVLHLAAANGHLAVVKFLLQNNAAVDAKDLYDCTVLHLAAANGHLPVVEFLLQNNAAVDAKDFYGRTVLHFAAANGHLPVVEFLLQNNAAVDAKDKAAVDTKDKYDSTALHLAAANGHLPVVEFLLQNNAAVDAKNKYRSTALHLAVANGHLAVVKFLLQNKAAVNQPNSFTKTPLTFAVEKDRTEFVELLLKNGAKVSKDILFLAVQQHCCVATVKYLLNYGEKALVNTKDIAKQTLLNWALALKYWLAEQTPNHSLNKITLDPATQVAVAKLLIESGADVNAKGEANRTPLYWALIMLGDSMNQLAEAAPGEITLDPATQVAVATLLVASGADMNAKGVADKTSLELALTLLENWMKQLSQDPKKIISNACSQVGFVKLLLQRGADMNAEDNRSKTPLSLMTEIMQDIQNRFGSSSNEAGD